MGIFQEVDCVGTFQEITVWGHFKRLLCGDISRGYFVFKRLLCGDNQISSLFLL